MLKIAICDDETYFRKTIKEYISNYLKGKEIPAEINTFRSGEEFLELGIELVTYTIVFLDINMEGLDGIVTAQKIREYSRDVFLVFVTAYINYSLEGYKVDAARYLLKNNINFEESIFECMETILEKMNYAIVKMKFKFQEGEKEVPLDRILFIESRLHKLEFHIMEDEIKVYTSYGILNELEDQLADYYFLRIHQSFLVNLKHIKSVSGYHVILNSNMELAIPKTRYKEVKNTFIAYKGEV